MVEPILDMMYKWWKPNVSAVTRASITEIEILDSYMPDASVTVKDSWDASAAADGSVMCYVIGTKLIIAGNGSGRIHLNEKGQCLFADADNDNYFTNVTSINGLSLLDLSKTTALSFMFYGCRSLTSLDLSGFVTSHVSYFQNMFSECKSLTSLDLRSFDTSNALNTSSMFSGCSSLALLDISSFRLPLVTFTMLMFQSGEEVQRNIIFPTDGFRLAGNCWGMFQNNLITSVDTSNWDTSACTSMNALFSGCKNLSGIDVSNWDVSNVTDMQFMFYGCSSIGEIDVSNWDVSKVTSFDHFAAHANLKRKGIENWKTTSATNMNALFHNCAEEELDLSGWDVSKNQFFCQMFENSPNLKRIKGLEKWNTSAGLGFDGMFERCSKLEEVDLSSFNTTKAKNGTSASTNGHKTATLQNMFLSCNNLKKVSVGPNFAVNGNGSNTTAANKLILPTPSTDYIEGADGNWYAFNGDPYAPNAIPDKTADTYFASFPLCQNEDVIVKNGSLIDTAKAIKEKNGATAKYTPAQFGAAIRAL